MQEERPVSHDDQHEDGNYPLVLRPDGHSEGGLVMKIIGKGKRLPTFEATN